MSRGRWCVLSLALCGCGDWTEAPDGLTEADHALIATMVLPTAALPDPTNAAFNDANAAHLGQELFYDVTLSNPSGVSCATCHDPKRAFTDGRNPNNVSQGVPLVVDAGTPLTDGGTPFAVAVPQFTKRNSPSLLDVGFYAWWGWDGRSDSLWMQCAVAYEAGATMHGTPKMLAQAIIDRYSGDYVAAFPSPLPLPSSANDPASAARIAANSYKAMAAYIALLTSSNAPFDQFAGGDPDALSASARRGLKLFLGKAGCITCHNGPGFNGAASARADADFFKIVGVAQSGDYVAPVDLGRFDGKGVLLGSIYNSAGSFNDAPGLNRIPTVAPPTDADRGQFRIKSLRNVATTGPFMHAGQIASLPEVVHFYNSGGDGTGYTGTRDRQLGPISLTASEEDDLVSFLESLTGDPPPSNLLCAPGKCTP